jgi:hypothetical protein
MRYALIATVVVTNMRQREYGAQEWGSLVLTDLNQAITTVIMMKMIK